MRQRWPPPTGRRSRPAPGWRRRCKGLRAPDGAGVDPGPALHGVLRPYQQAGVQWLHLLSGLGLGACLADDMGLGKTIQVLALLLAQKRHNGKARHQPSLLVAPASLLANWAAEIEKFAPELNAMIVHPSAMTAEQIAAVHAGADGGTRSGDHQLRLAAAHAGAGRNRVALRHSGRGAGDQEPERQADPGGQGAQGDRAHRADRNAGRESPRRSVVDLRFHQSRTAGIGRAIQALRQGPGRTRGTIRMARCASWCGPTSCGA